MTTKRKSKTRCINSRKSGRRTPDQLVQRVFYWGGTMADKSLSIEIVANTYRNSMTCDACNDRTTRLICGLGNHRICCHCALDIISELSKAIQDHGDNAAAQLEKGRSIDASA